MQTLNQPVLVDIHSHLSIRQDAGVISIKNIFYQDAGMLTDMEEYVSVGLHPWHIAGHPFQEDALMGFARDEKVLAIGETGLDKVKGGSLSQQMEIFDAHVRIAEDVQLPVIVHCVKYHQELIRYKRSINPKTQFIVHGFSGSVKLAEQYLNDGFLLSFGAGLQLGMAQLSDSLRTVPAHTLFLETDDSRVPIKEIYTIASRIRGVQEEELSKDLFNNYKRIFKRDKR